MMFNVLKHYHPMVSIPWLELQDAVFPPGVPAPKIPHLAGAILCVGPWGAMTGKPNPTEISGSGGIMLSRGTDIGPLIPHLNIPPAPLNLLLPVYLLTSASKSHFGASKDVLPQGPVAFACLKVINLNLNCAGATFPPLPSGVVLAFNSHVTGVTIGDLIAGLLHMVVDAAIQFGINRMFASQRATALMERATSKLLGPLTSRICGFPVFAHMGDWLGMHMVGSIPLGVRLFSQSADDLAVYGARASGELVNNGAGIVAGVLVGSPLGYGQPYGALGLASGAPLDAGHDGVQQSVDDYFNDPAVDDHAASSTDAGTSDESDRDMDDSGSGDGGTGGSGGTGGADAGTDSDGGTSGTSGGTDGGADGGIGRDGSGSAGSGGETSTDGTGGSGTTGGTDGTGSSGGSDESGSTDTTGGSGGADAGTEGDGGTSGTSGGTGGGADSDPDDSGNSGGSGSADESDGIGGSSGIDDSGSTGSTGGAP